MEQNKIYEGQPDQTGDQETGGAKAELKRAEQMARSVGGGETSPTLSGGKATKTEEKPSANISVGKKTSKK
jgi:hypothetical protein